MRGIRGGVPGGRSLASVVSVPGFKSQITPSQKRKERVACAYVRAKLAEAGKQQGSSPGSNRQA